MEMISVEKIDINNKYLRFNTDVSELEKSIQAIGLISPLTVNTDYQLLAGGRRFQAMKNLGFTDVPIIIYERDSLEQELVSIDENLVRKDLNNLEMEAHLRRAKDLHQKITSDDPSATVEIQDRVEYLSDSTGNDDENNNLTEQEVQASDKFVKDISEKTGLSTRQIYQAISRDEKSSDGLKEARNHGELNVSQTNEFIKLSKDEQESLLPIIKDKTVQDIKKIVKEVKKNGMERALELASTPTPNAREIKQLLSLLKRVKKIIGTLELEGVEVKGDSAQKLSSDLQVINEVVPKILPDMEYSNFDPSVLNQGRPLDEIRP